MSTIILREPGQFATIESSTISRQPDHALVRVHRVGICGTDLHAFEGTQPFFSYPRILGHELGVEILDIGENPFNLKPGDRCAIEPYLYCGTCIACRHGKTNCCENLKVLGVHVDGGMREQFTVPIHTLHKSDQLSFEQLALVETLGIGAHAINRANPTSEDSILVIGCGPIGLTATAFAKETGASVTVMDVSTTRLDFCRQELHLSNTVNANENVEEQLRSIHNGDLPSIVIDCTGNSKSMHNAFRYICNGGKLVFVGLFIGDMTFHDPDFHKRETTLLSSRNSTAKEFKSIIRLLESGKLDIQPWITHRVQQSRLTDTFPSWIKPETGVIKAVVEW